MMIRAASLPIEVNLVRFSHFLHSQGIAHRINEESGQQVIWVELDAHAALVQEALTSWSFEKESESFQSSNSLVNPGAGLRNLLMEFLRAPISLSLISVCLIVALVSSLGAAPGRVAILFYPLLDSSGFTALLLSIGGLSDMLRSVSPMLLHFGELHLVFNMMWLWYFGRQLEAGHPSSLTLLLILFCSFVANTTQYLYSGFNNFGGMSGVVYGLVGYTWLVHMLMPRSNLLINTKMFTVFVIALIAMEIFAGSWIASAAHVGGLFAGLTMGAAVVVLYRFLLGRESISR